MLCAKRPREEESNKRSFWSFTWGFSSSISLDGTAVRFGLANTKWIAMNTSIAQNIGTCSKNDAAVAPNGVHGESHSCDILGQSYACKWCFHILVMSSRCLRINWDERPLWMEVNIIERWKSLLRRRSSAEPYALIPAVAATIGSIATVWNCWYTPITLCWLWFWSLIRYHDRYPFGLHHRLSTSVKSRVSLWYLRISSQTLARRVDRHKSANFTQLADFDSHPELEFFVLTALTSV